MNRREATGRRDLGLARVRRATLAVSMAAAALVGALATLVSQALPGRSAQASSHQAPVSPSAPVSPPASAGSSQSTTPGLQAPASPPSTAPPSTAAPVVSGGS